MKYKNVKIIHINPLAILTWKAFDNWHTSRTYMRLILLADIMYGYPFGTLKIGFLERRKRKITSHRAESVAN